jgi:hypothetical protein
VVPANLFFFTEMTAGALPLHYAGERKHMVFTQGQRKLTRETETKTKTKTKELKTLKTELRHSTAAKLPQERSTTENKRNVAPGSQ